MNDNDAAKRKEKLRNANESTCNPNESMSNHSGYGPFKRIPGFVMRRGSNMSCHAHRGKGVGEHLQDEGVRARKRRTARRGRDRAYTDAPRQRASSRRNAHIVRL